MATEGIEHVILRADSTPDQWAAEIRGMLNLGFTDRAQPPKPTAAPLIKQRLQSLIS